MDLAGTIRSLILTVGLWAANPKLDGTFAERNNMNHPKLAGYENIEEFRRDFEIFRQNPNDKQFMHAVNIRVRYSHPQIQAEINDEIISGLMEANPKEFIRRVSAKIPPGFWIMIKSENDPFF